MHERKRINLVGIDRKQDKGLMTVANRLWKSTKHSESIAQVHLDMFSVSKSVYSTC